MPEQDPTQNFFNKIHQVVQERDKQVRSMSQDARRFIVRECKGVTNDMDIFMLAAHGIVPGEPTDKGREYDAYTGIAQLIGAVDWRHGVDVAVVDQRRRLERLVHIPREVADVGADYRLKGIRSVTEGSVQIPNCWQVDVRHIRFHEPLGMRVEGFDLAFLTQDHHSPESGYANINSRLGKFVVGLPSIYEELRPNGHHERRDAYDFEEALDYFTAQKNDAFQAAQLVS